MTVETDGTAEFDGARLGGATLPAGPLASLEVLGYSPATSGTVEINGGAVTTSGEQTYGDTVTLVERTPWTVTAARNVTFKTRVDAQSVGGESLAVQTDGTTEFDGAVGTTSLASLDVAGFSAATTGTTIFNAPGSDATHPSVKTTGSQTYHNAVQLDANTVR